jgi:hypothetical protein
MCINDKWVPEAVLGNVSAPVLGDIDIVTEEIEEADTDFIYYRLERFGKPWYRASMFATLPDQPAEITEKETVNLQPA